MGYKKQCNAWGFEKVTGNWKYSIFAAESRGAERLRSHP
jgi:hypothetical protein